MDKPSYFLKMVVNHIPAEASKVEYYTNLWNYILNTIRPSTILDVGGGEHPLKMATHVLDKTAYENRGEEHGFNRLPQQFNENTWVHHDFFDMPWPFPDKKFDYIYSTQTLEDIRDPIAVCKEMERVGKKGFIQTPNILAEITESFHHHRWFVRVYGGELQFLMKSPMLHASILLVKECEKLQEFVSGLDHKHRATNYFWEDKIIAREIYCTTEEEYIETFDVWVQEEINRVNNDRIKGSKV